MTLNKGLLVFKVSSVVQQIYTNLHCLQVKTNEYEGTK